MYKNQGDKKNGLPKTSSGGNIESNPRGDHQKVVDGCFEDHLRLQILLEHTTCSKIRTYAKQKIERSNYDHGLKTKLLSLIS
ncbi:MAG: hypothetical protein WCG25_00385 [bacterium]